MLAGAKRVVTDRGIGLAAALAGWWISIWSFWQVEDGESVAWLLNPGPDSIRTSPRRRGLILDLGVVSSPTEVR